VGAITCLLLMLRPGSKADPKSSQSASVEQIYREVATLFPNQVRAIVFEQAGTRLVIADEANVPSSPPYYLKICLPRGCQSVVTFSGQVIHVGGESFEVLANAQGQVMLVGNDRVWSGNTPGSLVRVESRQLEASL